MSTLSLDLRGGAATRVLGRQAPTKGAGVSLLFHGLGVSTLIVLPLLQATNPPEVANPMATPLARPLTVILPPAPLPTVRRVSRSVAPAPVASVPTTPAQTPTTLSLVSDLDTGPILDVPSSLGGDLEGAAEGTCPLGSLCGAAAVPLEVPTPGLVRIGGVIREPRLMESRAPVYPPVAQAAGVSGTVILEAHVGQDGWVKEVRITQGHSLFDEAAVASVRSRRYQPLLLNGVPTEFLITITVAFNLRR